MKTPAKIECGTIPLAGRYTPKVWAVFLGCDVATVRQYVTKYDIPYRKPGDEMYIDAADFWASIPVQRKSTNKTKRGGARRSSRSINGKASSMD